MIDSFVDGMAEGLGRVADWLHDAGDIVDGWADSFSHWTLDGIGQTVEQMTPWDALDKFLTEAGVPQAPTRITSVHEHWYSDPLGPEGWLTIKHRDGDPDNNDLDNLVVSPGPVVALTPRRPDKTDEQARRIPSPTFDGFPLPSAGGPPEA